VDGSIYEYMRIGVVHCMAFPACITGEGPILETVTQIAEDPFFNAIEITGIHSADTRANVRDVLKTAGLACAYAAQPAVLTQKLNPNSFCEDERTAAVTALKERVDEAREVGATSLALLSGPDPGAARREEAIGILARSLRELCDYGLDSDVAITLETFDRTIDKRALIGPSDDAVTLARLVNRDNFGLMVDLSHLPLQFESAQKALTATQYDLVHVHIGNCVMRDPDHPAYGDQHPHFGVEGGENGVDELVEFLRVLMDIEYLTPSDDPPLVSFEVKPMEGQSSEVVLANAKRTLTEAWARL
jgi:sugar phosphate isomerase/epimerase